MRLCLATLRKSSCHSFSFLRVAHNVGELAIKSGHLSNGTFFSCIMYRLSQNSATFSKSYDFPFSQILPLKSGNLKLGDLPTIGRCRHTCDQWQMMRVMILEATWCLGAVEDRR